MIITVTTESIELTDCKRSMGSIFWDMIPLHLQCQMVVPPHAVFDARNQTRPENRIVLLSICSAYIPKTYVVNLS